MVELSVVVRVVAGSSPVSHPFGQSDPMCGPHAQAE